MECKWCSRVKPIDCITMCCKLSPGCEEEFKSTLQRIKAHCKDCAADNDPKECDGRLLRPNGNNNVCRLHPYRLGKNPERKKRAPLTMEQVKKRLEGLAEYHKKLKTAYKNPA